MRTLVLGKLHTKYYMFSTQNLDQSLCWVHQQIDPFSLSRERAPENGRRHSSYQVKLQRI